jgi:hypothetical protein
MDTFRHTAKTFEAAFRGVPPDAPILVQVDGTLQRTAPRPWARGMRWCSSLSLLDAPFPEHRCRDHRPDDHRRHD